MVRILGYGEDALTFWALSRRLDHLLTNLGDSTPPSDCLAFFRPSFGRRGGAGSAQFGEFDWILLTRAYLYLGESKWDKSSEKLVDRELLLRDEQLERHEAFRFYLKHRAFAFELDWSELREQGPVRLSNGVVKPIAPEKSTLAENLCAVLEEIRTYYEGQEPLVKDILLYLYAAGAGKPAASAVNGGFTLVPLAYSSRDAGMPLVRLM
ncbi:MAG TPA: hypothetical protein PKJ21_10515 [Anaerolineae bacterium]|nr:hypothetical protein [Anaerolineae bacterium]